MKKERLDILLVQAKLAETRAKAQALILAGDVLVNDSPETKAGTRVPLDATLRIRDGGGDAYVSRSAHKLLGALETFQIEVRGRTGLDVGASTGGFTQVLLEKGATRVIALDVGHNQLDWKIRSDPRVKVLEGVNARDMAFSIVGEKVGLIVVDVSFISLQKILPNLRQFSDATTDWVTLVKPQFEVGRDKVGKGGIVRSEEDQRSVVNEIQEFGKTIGLRERGLVKSSITGTHGNQEYLIHWKNDG